MFSPRLSNLMALTHSQTMYVQGSSGPWVAVDVNLRWMSHIIVVKTSAHSDISNQHVAVLYLPVEQRSFLAP